MSEEKNNLSLQLYQRMADPVAAIQSLGDKLGGSCILGFTKREQGIVLAWEAMATGQSPFAILRKYHITERGRFVMRADAMLAEFRSRGGRVKWTRHDPSAVVGIWEFEGNKTEVGYTIEQARSAGYVRQDSGWTKDPEAQLQAACIRKAIRMLAPEVIVSPGENDETPEFPQALSMPAQEPPQQMKPANVFSVETVEPKPPQTPVQEKKAEPVVVVTPPAPAPAPATPEVEPPRAPLADELQADVETVIAGFATDAVGWLIANRYLPAGGNLSNLTPAFAKNIIAKPDKFREVVLKWKTENQKTN